LPDPYSASSGDTPPRAAAAWPPAPSGMPTPAPRGGDISEFETQSEWIVFLLIIVTLGLYMPFWLIRTNKVIARIDPAKEIAPGAIWTVLGLLIVDDILQIAAGADQNTQSPVHMLSGGCRILFTIYYWFIIFKFRSVLNGILDRTPSLKKFGVLGTLIFGVLYLQARINMRKRDAGYA
jgi:hypothetical protein